MPMPLGKLVIPAGIGRPTPEVAAHALAVAEQVRVRTREKLLAGSAGGTLQAMFAAIEAAGARAVETFEDALSERLAADAGARGEMASVQCRRGCAFCCHVDVVVTPLEAIRVAGAMQQGTLADRRSLAQGPRARNAPCPLLIDSACSAYAMRPFACRSLFSPDVSACEAGFAAEGAGGAPVFVPSLHWPRLLAAGTITGEGAALDDLGLASHLVELRGALALADEANIVRWLNGADVFPRR
jgi:hypothetical protein